MSDNARMKRHLSLEPFSRDHNDGLILARRIIEAVGAEGELRAQFLKAWDDELCDHFGEEERLLSALSAPEMVARLIAEHRAIEVRIAEMRAREVSLTELQHTARLLEDHIRWEERGLFPHIEGRATEEQLRELLAGTDVLELRRHEIDPKRAKLVMRRWDMLRHK